MATIHDVARAARVSIATVSRALNGSPRVSEEAQRRVWEAATKLDYWPNGAARSLTQRQTHAIGILLPDLYGEFFSEVIRGADHAARQEKLQTLITSSHANADELVSAARSMRGRVDGLIVMATEQATAEAIDPIRRRFPVVLMNPGSRVEGCSTVSIANFDGAYAAVDHLLGLGHSSVAVIKGPSGNADAEGRLRGYRRALHNAGIEPVSALEFEGDFTESSGYEVARRILQHVPRPTAVFASNDSMAIGLLSALGTHGVGVPRDMAVVGFDDIAISRYISPPLTTVHVDAYELGARSVRLLISMGRGAGPTTCSHEVLPTTLAVRHSCGCTEAQDPSPLNGDLSSVPQRGDRKISNRTRRSKP